MDQHDIKQVDENCEHEWGKTIYKVLFYAGAYQHEMVKCKKCKGFISADMQDHKNGRHNFVIPREDGFLQCDQCILQKHPTPVMNIGRR